MANLLEWLRGFLAMIGSILRSRKFLAALGATIALLVQEPPLPPEQLIIGIVTIWVGYIFGTALEDGLAKNAGK